MRLEVVPRLLERAREAAMTPGRGLVLVGYRGAGKTTVGARLAARLGLRFVDTDALVERAAGMSVREIFERLGEATFRDHERRAIEGLDAGEEQVVAAGGGAVTDGASSEALARLGEVVWLVAPPEVLAARIAGTGRPSLTGAAADVEVGEVLERREPLYRALARWVVQTAGNTPDEVCDELQRLWRGPAAHDVR
jgi:shikimate kinase